RGQAKFAAAGLVAELERDVLFAERGIRKRRDRHAKNHGALVDVQWCLGKSEFFEFALGIRDFAAVEAGGKFGLEIGGDEIVLRFFAAFAWEAGRIFITNGDLERPSAAAGTGRALASGFDTAGPEGILRCNGGGRTRQ